MFNESGKSRLVDLVNTWGLSFSPDKYSRRCSLEGNVRFTTVHSKTRHFLVKKVVFVAESHFTEKPHLNIINFQRGDEGCLIRS